MNEEQYGGQLPAKMNSSDKLWIHLFDTLFKRMPVACSVQKHGLGRE